MTATITIWSNRTIATLGMLILSSIFLINIANAQCTSDPLITVKQDEVEIRPFGNTFCWIDIPYRIVNPGPCEMTGFTMFFSVTTPSGTENILHNITGPLSPNTPYEDIVGFPSALLKNIIDNDCYEVSEIEISTLVSTLETPTSITEVIDCPFGTGSIVVCANDHSIICDDSGCEPFACTPDVLVNVLAVDLAFTEVENGNCQLEIPYSLTSNGVCDLGTFNLEMIITTPIGTDTLIETISGIQAGEKLIESIQFSSAIITADGGVCLPSTEVTIEANIPMQGDVITTTVPCPNGNGTIEVCTNNPSIICDDTNCIPFSCEEKVDLVVDLNNLEITEAASGLCEITIPYFGENLGDCDVTGFDVEITISSPNGSQVFVVSQAGPINSLSTFTNSFTSESTILSTPGVDCFDLSELNISLSISETAAPRSITTTMACPTSLGTIVVCANNPNIVCDDSMCEMILPIDLVSLEGRAKDELVLINWETAFEIDNDYFLVQHSEDAKEFTSVGMIAGKGDSHDLTSYEFLHEDAITGDNYYRLVAVDIDGHLEVSETIVVEIKSTKLNVTLSPNPAHDFINLNGLEGLDGSLKANIYTADGQLYRSWNLENDRSIQRVDISDLDTGFYILSITQGTDTENFKFIKF